MECIECKIQFQNQTSLLNHINTYKCLKTKRLFMAKNLCIECKKNINSYYLTIYQIPCNHIINDNNIIFSNL